MKRAEATRRLEKLLARVAAQDDRYLCLITEVSVFGSYASGALNVGDVDLEVEHEHDRELSMRFVSLISYGQDVYLDFNRALRGRQRVFQIHYNAKQQLAAQLPGHDPVLLWRRGDSYGEALRRLHAIREDPHAGRTPRDPVAPALEGLDRRIPRPQRQKITELAAAGRLNIERIELPEARPSSPIARLIEQRWGPANPMRRAGLAAAAWLELQGMTQLRLKRYGHTVLADRSARAAAGIGGKGFTEAIELLLENRGELWLEVVNPSLRAPLVGIVLRPRAS